MPIEFKDSIDVDGNIKASQAFIDSNNSAGTIGQILTSTGSVSQWSDVVSGASTLVEIACKNTSGGTITVGTPVYQIGTVGATATIEVAPANALISAGNYPAIGLLKTTLGNNDIGFVVITGALTNIITSPIDGVVPTTGDTVYLKSGGGLTLTKPTGEGNAIQNMGLVGKVSTGTSGSITVSSIMRANDVPNLPTGRIWVGDGNTLVSNTVFVDEPNLRLGLGIVVPTEKLHVEGNARVTGAFIDSNNQSGTTGQVLSSTATGTDWITLSATTWGSITGTLSSQTDLNTALDNTTLIQTSVYSGTHSLILSDRDTNIENNDDLIIEIPLNSSVAFPIGTQIFFTKKAETITFDPTTGTQLNSVDGLVEMGRRNCGASLLKIGTDEWNLIGELV